MSITKRKAEHVEISISGRAAYQKTTGFERYDFVHNALPEIDLDEVTSEISFLGRAFAFPLFISSMTGGYAKGGAVNATIAAFCEKENLPFGVGSQRILIEKPESKDTFSVVRDEAPHAFIAANLGGCQVAEAVSSRVLRIMIDSIEADAIIVHLNVLQELMQPEGDRSFKGILEGISKLVKAVELPVIVKETGAGINAAVAHRLVDAGVQVIDVAGAGGTSWSRIENERDPDHSHKKVFDEWGMPTVDCLLDIRENGPENCEIIASGGIRSSLDIAKSLCMGAGISATAQPVIKAIIEHGYDGLEQLYNNWQNEFRFALCLLGCRNPSDLSMKHLREVCC
ncbi:MAG TPA: type 2 isopentenyl-diphosphate Delta-isomerase [Balneolales bacterium]|nr:type 2 isopentenyl-diphosphate Delta-isomerase [Balneolales bacterium]